MKIELDKIEKDDVIYPRQEINHSLVERYTKDMKGGDEFPPLVVQRISIDGNKKTIIMDGWHRKLAYEQYNNWASENGKEPKEEVECNYYKDRCLPRDEYLEELIYASIRYNRKHNFGVTYSDMEQQGIEILRRKPIEEVKRGLKKEIAEEMGIPPSSVYKWKEFDKVYQKRRTGKDSLIYRLSQLGWTQEEISKVVGLGIGTVSENFGSLKNQITEIQHEFYEEHKSVSEIAEYQNWESLTVWSMVLYGKRDKERFRIFGMPKYQDDKPMVYDVWNFTGRDERLGDEHKANIPGQIVMNVLHRYSEQGDLVVDPMAGGGVTVDASLIMGRECRAYDIDNEVVEARPSIKKNDVTEGYPTRAQGADLVFLDPFYGNKVTDRYETKEDFLNFVETLAKNTYNTIREGGYVAFLQSNFKNYENELKSIFTAESFNIFKDVGFEPVMEFQCPLSTEQYTGFQVKQARKKDKILIRSRTLYIFKKVKQN